MSSYVIDESKYRKQRYEAYRPLDELSAELGVSNYNAYENITGLYFKKGDKVEVRVGDSAGEKLTLIVKNWSMVDGDEYRYNLSEGLNTLTMKGCAIKTRNGIIMISTIIVNLINSRTSCIKVFF